MTPEQQIKKLLDNSDATIHLRQDGGFNLMLKKTFVASLHKAEVRKYGLHKAADAFMLFGLYLKHFYNDNGTPRT